MSNIPTRQLLIAAYCSPKVEKIEADYLESVIDAYDEKGVAISDKAKRITIDVLAREGNKLADVLRKEK